LIVEHQTSLLIEIFFHHKKSVLSSEKTFYIKGIHHEDRLTGEDYLSLSKMQIVFKQGGMLVLYEVIINDDVCGPALVMRYFNVVENVHRTNLKIDLRFIPVVKSRNL